MGWEMSVEGAIRFETPFAAQLGPEEIRFLLIHRDERGDVVALEPADSSMYKRHHDDVIEEVEECVGGLPRGLSGVGFIEFEYEWSVAVRVAVVDGAVKVVYRRPDGWPDILADGLVWGSAAQEADEEIWARPS